MSMKVIWDLGGKAAAKKRGIVKSALWGNEALYPEDRRLEEDRMTMWHAYKEFTASAKLLYIFTKKTMGHSGAIKNTVQLRRVS